LATESTAITIAQQATLLAAAVGSLRQQESNAKKERASFSATRRDAQAVKQEMRESEIHGDWQQKGAKTGAVICQRAVVSKILARRLAPAGGD
jgi:hypothetical protein